MRLIIDIPDEQYEYIKQSDKNTFADVSSKECMLYAIKNGTPVSTEGDLISRSALKKEFQDRLSTCEDWINHTECDISRAIATRDFCIEVIMTINNAPTVTNGTYEQGFRVGAYGRLDEIRPHGEWKHHEEYTNNRTFYITECPFCKLRVQEETNFCPECGADMRGNKG